MSCKDGNDISNKILIPSEEDVKGRPDYELLAGFYRTGIGQVMMKVMKEKSTNGSIGRMKVRYKPKEVQALYIEDEHLVRIYGKGERRSVRTSGWLVQGPAGVVFYVPEDKFSDFFEIISE